MMDSLYYKSFSQELEKIAASPVKPGLMRRLMHKVVDYSPGVNPVAEEGLGKVDRFRQKVRGDLVRNYADRYENMAPGPEKNEFLRRLSQEDNDVMRARLLAGGAALAGTTGAMVGTSALVGKGMEYAGNKAIEHATGESMEAPEGVEDREHVKNQLDKAENWGKPYVGDLAAKGTRELVERTLVDGAMTDKMTLSDPYQAMMNTSLAKLTNKMTGKPMLGNLLGTQVAYHGTTPEAVQKIMQTGLDPSYGGVEGGGAWRMQKRQEHAQEAAQASKALKSAWRRGDITEREFVEKQKGITGSLLDKTKDMLGVDDKMNLGDTPHIGKPSVDVRTEHHAADKAVQPHMTLMGAGRRVPVDAGNFVDQAKGKTYVGKGGLGRFAAGWYGMVSHPETSARLGEAVEGSKKKFMKHYGDHITGHLDGTDPLGLPKYMGNTILRLPVDMSSEMDKYKDLVFAPKNPNVVAMAMPSEEYDQKFVRDHDDVTRMQTGHWSKEKVDPSRLNPTDVTAKQILQNRSKNWLQYAKKHPGQLASGVGMAGLNALTTGAAVKSVGRLGWKMLPGQAQDKLRDMKNNAVDKATEVKDDVVSKIRNRVGQP